MTLAGVAATLAEGQKLYLVVSPVSDQFNSNGSRTPGALVLRDTVVQLPVVAREAAATPARPAGRRQALDRCGEAAGSAGEGRHQ